MFTLLLSFVSSKIFLSSADERSFLVWMRSSNQLFTGSEYHFRKGIYISNMRYVQEFNRAHQKSFTLSLNRYAAYTQSEYTSLLGVIPKRSSPNIMDPKEIRRIKTNANLNVPDSFDWREKGAVNPVKDQASCGGCWAFSAIQMQESVHQLATGNLLVLAEQFLIDCADIDCSGCFGGWPEGALKSVLQHYGGKFCLESQYSYKAAEGKCNFAQVDHVSNIVAIEGIEQSNEEAMKEHVATKGPVSICVDASHAKFMLYNGGIYEDTCTRYVYNHAMGVVGYGTEGGKDFWIVRNSWGPSWGESGYIRYLRGVDTCNIADYVIYSVYE